MPYSSPIKLKSEYRKINKITTQPNIIPNWTFPPRNWKAQEQCKVMVKEDISGRGEPTQPKKEWQGSKFCIRVGLILSSSIKQCSSTKMEDEERFLGRGWVGGGSSEGITSTQPLCLLHKCNKIQRSILMDQKLQSGRDCDRHWPC